MKNNFNLNPIKPGLLTQAEQFFLTPDLKGIMLGLLLGDIHAQKRSKNTNLFFEQSVLHEDYLLHLYDLFKLYCISGPKLSVRAPSKVTGKVYSSLRFQTMALPCFNEFYDLFFLLGPKVVPSNIKELLTPLSLAYWICDNMCALIGWWHIRKKNSSYNSMYRMFRLKWSQTPTRSVSWQI